MSGDPIPGFFFSRPVLPCRPAEWPVEPSVAVPLSQPVVYTAAPVGWVCPNCRRGVAPSEKVCPACEPKGPPS